MSSITLWFKDDGTVTSVWHDVLTKLDLGPAKVKRASTIEFNDRRQVWEVRLAGRRGVAFRHPSRTACLRWEKQQLEKQP